ncbi:hypothetical protein M885DRAFT_519841 [Pelagophyceae sp. CCMP2097]|nr:hypothetical protein M885DRAFT_519841 [Pelagophyceae sp. CCMP2097]
MRFPGLDSLETRNGVCIDAVRLERAQEGRVSGPRVEREASVVGLSSVGPLTGPSRPGHSRPFPGPSRDRVLWPSTDRLRTVSGPPSAGRAIREGPSQNHSSPTLRRGMGPHLVGPPRGRFGLSREPLQTFEGPPSDGGVQDHGVAASDRGGAASDPQSAALHRLRGRIGPSPGPVLGPGQTMGVFRLWRGRRLRGRLGPFSRPKIQKSKNPKIQKSKNPKIQKHKIHRIWGRTGPFLAPVGPQSVFRTVSIWQVWNRDVGLSVYGTSDRRGAAIGPSKDRVFGAVLDRSGPNWTVHAASDRLWGRLWLSDECGVLRGRVGPSSESVRLWGLPSRNQPVLGIEGRLRPRPSPARRGVAAAVRWSAAAKTAKTVEASHVRDPVKAHKDSASSARSGSDLQSRPFAPHRAPLQDDRLGRVGNTVGETRFTRPPFAASPAPFASPRIGRPLRAAAWNPPGGPAFAEKKCDAGAARGPW